MSLPRPTTMRLGVRLARRELWRRRGRSILVLLLVFVPALVMTGLVSFLRTSEYTRAEFAAARYGRADARTRDRVPPTRDSLRALRAALPPGTSVIVERNLEDRVRAGDRRAYFSITDLAPDHPMAEGRYGAVRGRLPVAPGEAVISEEVARGLDVGIGDTVRPDRLERSLRVVGTVRVRLPGYVAGEGALTDSDGLVVVSEALPDSAFTTSTVWVDVPGRRPAPGADLHEALGVSPVAGTELFPIDAHTETDQTSGVFWAYLGGAVGLIVLATIITAAFAVGARRQLSIIGLLSSTGASPATIKWFLVTQGAVLGAVGSLAGVATGALLVRLTPQRLLDSMNVLHVDGVMTRPLDLLPIVVLGTAVAAGAAWLPARSTAKIPTLQALAGRRPLGTVPRRLPILGGVSILAGCALFGATIATLTSGGASALLLFPIAGSMAVLFGAIAIAPWVIERIEHGSARLPETWRLAGRSLGRSRVRSSAVVGAVCAVTVAVVAGTTIYASLGPDSDECCQLEIPDQRADQVILESFLGPQAMPISDDLVRRAHAVVPRAAVVEIAELSEPGNEVVGGFKPGVFASYVTDDNEDGNAGYRAAAVTPELLDVLGVPDNLRAALHRGDAISVVRPPFATDKIRLSFPSGQATLKLGGSFDSPAASGYLPTILVSPETAASYGLTGRELAWTLLQLPQPLTDQQRRELELLHDDIRWEGRASSSAVPVEAAPPEPVPKFEQVDPTASFLNISLPSDNFEVSTGYVKAIILAISMLLIIGVVAVGLALAARDSEDEGQILSAVGAAPPTLRRIGALRGMFLTLTAGVIAVPAALLASAVIVAASDTIRVFRVDWWAVVFVVAVVPLVVGAVALAGARLRDAIRPPRPDVFAFSE